MRSETKVERKIRIPSRQTGETCSLTIEGFSKEEYEKVIGAIESGRYYVSVIDGKFVAHSVFEELPDPIEDKEMYPFWRACKPHNQQVQSILFEEYEHSTDTGYSPSISISSLCGYYYTKENYEKYARRLESYGFYQLRSKREDDGKFWENWYLPSLFLAKGDLEDAIKGIKDEKQQLKIALKFLSRKIQFGSLDVSSQRMCMVIED